MACGRPKVVVLNLHVSFNYLIKETRIELMNAQCSESEVTLQETRALAELGHRPGSPAPASSPA